MHRVTKNCLAIQFYFIKETIKSEPKDHKFFIIIIIFFYKDMHWKKDTELTRSYFRMCFMPKSHPVDSWGKPNPIFFLWGCGLGHELRNWETALILVRKPFKGEVINLFQPHHALTTCWSWRHMVVVPVNLISAIFAGKMIRNAYIAEPNNSGISKCIL